MDSDKSWCRVEIVVDYRLVLALALGILIEVIRLRIERCTNPGLVGSRSGLNVG